MYQSNDIRVSDPPHIDPAPWTKNTGKPSQSDISNSHFFSALACQWEIFADWLIFHVQSVESEKELGKEMLEEFEKRVQ